MEITIAMVGYTSKEVNNLNHEQSHPRDHLLLNKIRFKQIRNSYDIRGVLFDAVMINPYNDRLREVLEEPLLDIMEPLNKFYLKEQGQNKSFTNDNPTFIGDLFTKPKKDKL